MPLTVGLPQLVFCSWKIAGSRIVVTLGSPYCSRFLRLSQACGAALTLFFTLPNAVAQTTPVTQFYAGKTIKMLLPTAPGGGRALYALPFAEAFSRHIPGNPKVLPVFMPGAGGSTAINNAHNVAEPDGLTIVSPLKGAVIAQAIGDPSVKYDVRAFNWIGRITDATQIFFVSNRVNARTIDDFRQNEIVIGAVGRASVTYQIPAFIKTVFGTKFKIVTGYPSAGATNLSVATGETQGAFTTWNDLQSYHPDWLREGSARVVIQIALRRHRDLKEIPLLTDFASDEDDQRLVEFMSSSSELGQTFAAPPGVPAPVVDALRKAFDETMKDVGYIEKLRKANIEFNPMSGRQLTDEILKTLATPKPLINRYQAAIN
jgi:tripartite-type tricarboxylate transporter receptor subunit TctC